MSKYPSLAGTSGPSNRRGIHRASKTTEVVRGNPVIRESLWKVKLGLSYQLSQVQKQCNVSGLFKHVSFYCEGLKVPQKKSKADIPANKNKEAAAELPGQLKS